MADSPPDLTDQLARHGVAIFIDAADRYTKSEANYREADDDSERCGACTHFDAGQCRIVAGDIDAEYVCDFFHDSGESARPSADNHRSRADSGDLSDGAD